MMMKLTLSFLPLLSFFSFFLSRLTFHQFSRGQRGFTYESQWCKRLFMNIDFCFYCPLRISFEYKIICEMKKNTFTYFSIKLRSDRTLSDFSLHSFSE